jgi:hypothetical protein
VSPYQNGAGAVSKAESTKLLIRQAVMGLDASFVPLKSRQFGELVGTRRAAGAGTAITTRINSLSDSVDALAANDAQYFFMDGFFLTTLPFATEIPAPPAGLTRRFGLTKTPSL